MTSLKPLTFCLLASTAWLPAHATNLEVTHWWTSGSEADAIRVIAEAFAESGHTWVDGAIAGAGGIARPLITSRITGGDPMGATQFTHSSAMRELIESGFMRDVTELAQTQGWKDAIFPQSLLDSCTFEGKIFCVPSNIHSQQWLWLNNSVFIDNGLDVPQNWDAFVAAAPVLRENGIIPLAQGQQAWQQQLLFNVLMVSIGGPDLFERIYREREPEFAAGPEMSAVFVAAGEARDMMRGSNIQEWNLAAQLVADGRAAGQIMGDWVQGEFMQAGMTPGEDLTCLPGLGVHQYITAAGDAFYFPKVTDPDVIAAQDILVGTIVAPETQLAFTKAKGALPVRLDIELVDPTPCMQRGMEILSQGNVVESVNTMVSPDTLGRVTDLVVEFFADTRFSVEQAQAEFVDIIASAD
ncbi:ABC transporter substrate-binding protein [Roseinatronobacter alkalisoli]|uniref:Probable sugar-binding periplasmic protein n=1 Tax=Roseinatronobacter alkalisoli TaxID=3028235 RepID=A0ABT5TDE2_9RHOB|nr:ABC transporter substrate-binding protein [Roseinatronobacter sp. HJB301]MDD7973133.1 ABC transporter substrate-binding protein [Roseinatronobacter sp. HJB301]